MKRRSEFLPGDAHSHPGEWILRSAVEEGETWDPGDG